MGIVIGLNSQLIELQGDEIVIGRSPAAQISLPGDARLAERHAVLRLVAGRWLIEAQGEATIRVGDGRPTKVCWLNSNDVIDLTATGPQLQFFPSQSARPPAVPAAYRPALDASRPISPPASTSAGAMKSVAGLSGAVVALVLFSAWYALWPKEPPDPGLIRPPGNTAEEPGPADPGIPSPIPDPPGPVAQSPSFDQAVFIVLMQNPKTQRTLRVGTACSIGDRRLVTSADVIHNIRMNRESFPRCFVKSAHESLTADVMQIGWHSKRQELLDIALNAQAEVDVAKEQQNAKSAPPLGEAEAQRLKGVLNGVWEKGLQAAMEMPFFNVGLLKVNQDLPRFLKLASSDDPVANGAAVHMYRLQLSTEHWDGEIIPDASLVAQDVIGAWMTSGPRLKAAPNSPARQSIVRFQPELVPFERKMIADVWFGCPVVSEAGEVLGVYNGPNPPPPDKNWQNDHIITGVGLWSEIKMISLDDL